MRTRAGSSNGRGGMLANTLPRGVRVVRVTGNGNERVLTLVLTVPEGVVNLWAEALEIAGRMAGSDRLGAALQAMSQEVLSTWLPLQEEAERRVLAALPGAANGAAGRTSPRP